MNFLDVEKKWQNIWDDKKAFEASNKSDKEKYYVLVEFPYPSGAGLHVGHVRSYSALDAMSRMKRLQGYNVLFPMGWDAFGAPAEQYAIKNHVYPADAVKENIKVFKSQIKSLGLSFDWSREFSTTDPEYYKWTQWQFLQFYKKNMAYKAEKEINWCPVCKTGLSNEDAAGGVCERCGNPVTKKLKSQWILRMSDYADRLLDGLKDTEFEERIKTAQINWIGRSEGAEVDFKLKDTEDYLKVFTTRPDTLYGVTFMVMSPEHSYIEKYADRIKNIEKVRKYQEEAKQKSDIERTNQTREKTGVKLEGISAINPVNNEEIEIWISDYVLSSYGTGAIMAVPAHDERDWAFAKKFGIKITPVIERITGEARKDEVHKDSIVAVVYNPKNKKYLTINWHEKGGRLFIGGTKQKGESDIDCAIREIAEETGYTDITYQRSIMPINHHYFAYNKNKAYEIESTGLLFNLNSEKTKATNLDEDEAGNFDIEWVSEDVVRDEVKDELHITTFENCLNENAFTGDGKMINSGPLNGITNKSEAIKKMLDYLEKEKIGKRKVNYRLQDWIFSRQRFWGEPIPMIYCEDCGWVPVPEDELPVLLPKVAHYEPTDTGESPLANIEDWVNTPCPKCGKMAKRETDTMPNWAGSSWYWLRYMDPHNDKEFVSKEALKYWGMVDYYNGGMEHATRHLLYARFWHQFLYDQGLVPTPEPFKKRVAHGMILNSDGKKFSKSSGNGVRPEDMVNEYGADALRLFEMFIGDYEKDALWNEDGVRSARKYLDRVERLKAKVKMDDNNYSKALEVIINKTIKKVSNDLATMKYNTAVSSLMILTNSMEEQKEISKKDYETLLILLNPICPHITEELNEQIGNKPIYMAKWPEYDENKCTSDEVQIGVQINGKLRGSILTNTSDSEDEILDKAKANENVKKYIEGKEIVKTIVIPGKIVNIVVKN